MKKSLQSLVKRLLDLRSYSRFQDFRIVSNRIRTVAQKDIDHSRFRIRPCRNTGESGMSETFIGYTFAGRTYISEGGSIESGSTAIRFAKLTTRKFFHHFF